ncbi:putative LTR copia-type gag-polypeptide [Tanacetum coccineum]
MYQGQIFSKSVWDEFKETYDKIDGSVIYNLHYKICSLTQSGSSLSEYYHSYNSLWRQFDSLVNLPSCSYDSASKLKDHKDLMRLMQFIMGLDDTYNVVKSQILTTEPLPDVKYTFATLSRVESIRTILCFKLIGYPPGYKNNNSGGSNVSNTASSSLVKSDQSAGNSLPFNTDQINRLMALIESKPDSGVLAIVDQGFIYGVSADVDTSYSSKSCNGLEFV